MVRAFLEDMHKVCLVLDGHVVSATTTNTNDSTFRAHLHRVVPFIVAPFFKG